MIAVVVLIERMPNVMEEACATGRARVETELSAELTRDESDLDAVLEKVLREVGREMKAAKLT